MPKQKNSTSSSAIGLKTNYPDNHWWPFLMPALIADIGGFSYQYWRAQQKNFGQMLLGFGGLTLSLLALFLFTWQGVTLVENVQAKLSSKTTISLKKDVEKSVFENEAVVKQISYQISVPTQQETFKRAELEQKLAENLALLAIQPDHQSLLINTALIYAQLQDTNHYQTYLEHAKKLNPNSTLFPNLVENVQN